MEGESPMPEEILYCSTCGKRIPPEEAEAEDFQLLGGELACEACLAQAFPERKQKLREVRSTRLRWRAERAAALAQAQPPRQIYPPPGTASPPPSSDTAVAAVKRELEEDADPQPPVKPVETAAATEGATGKPRRILLLWGLLVAGLSAIVAMLLVTPAARQAAQKPADAGARRIPKAAIDVKKAVAESATEPAGLPPVQVALAEIELIRRQVGDTPSLAAAEVAMAKLRAIAQRADEPARSTALAIGRRYERQVDAAARQFARDAAERAEDLAAQRMFGGAVEQLRAAVRALPEASPWVQKVGRQRMAATIERWSDERRRQLSSYGARLESELAVGHGGQVERLVAELAQYPESEFRDLARAYANQLAALREREEQRRRDDEEAARAAWPGFFAAYDGALAQRDFDGAARLCAPEADSALRRGGVAQPEAVLAGFAEEAERVRNLFPRVLRHLDSLKGERVQLRLTTGQVEGVLLGVQDGQLLLSAGNRIEIRLPPSRLSSEALALLLKDAPREEWAAALAALRFAEAPRQAEERSLALSALYQELRLPLPVCWAQRFEFERRLRWREALMPRMEALRKAVGEGRVPVIREALAQVRTLSNGGSLTKEEVALIAEAERAVGQARVVQVVFQNGRLPVPEFQGLRIDQIGSYHRSADQFDFEMKNGLRVGAAGGLLRALLRFDGLSELLGRGRLLKATLELYQPEGTAAPNAAVALYPLRRAWTPDASSWMHADRGGLQTWEKPGASGEKDADAQAVAQVLLDGQSGLWRSWDLSDYLRGVWEGRWKDEGLLMRVARDEPRFLVHFCVEEGPAAVANDPALRPRLVVEFEKFGP